MDLIITIDTEADNQWTRLKTFTTENARYIPRLQGLCDQFGFKPTYLCTYEMVTDFRCREILGPYQESGRAEIGAHLHPWSNPPFAPELGDWPEHHTFPHELPIDLFEQKMVMLTEAIRQTFGRSPTSYRAGRYGFHASHANVLLHLGYFVDCSVTPYLSWKTHTGIPGGIGGANFREARPGASILGWKENGSREMADGLLEVPIPFSSRAGQCGLGRAARRGGLTIRRESPLGCCASWGTGPHGSGLGVIQLPDSSSRSTGRQSARGCSM